PLLFLGCLACIGFLLAARTTAQENLRDEAQTRLEKTVNIIPALVATNPVGNYPKEVALAFEKCFVISGRAADADSVRQAVQLILRSIARLAGVFDNSP
ncbi:MAG: hypothetical protein GWO21_04080, partial [Gammaproteobacteria bacterium]|nr:hypothetical protein [Gammaproteobacteria bacterium]